jgi:uncharacterized membrane protein
VFEATSRMHRHLLIVVGAILGATLVGLVALWPAEVAPSTPDRPQPDLLAGEIVAAEVVGEDESVGPDTEPDTAAPTDAPAGPRPERLLVRVRVLDGPDAGAVADLELSAEGYPEFSAGDRVVLAPADIPGSDQPYVITDFDRMPVLWLLLGVFVAAVLAVGRWHGLRSLIGLAISLAIVIRFIVPAILAGSSPPLVALVGALAVMIVTLYLVHGVTEMTTAAVVGTAASLTLTVALGTAFIQGARITGFASDQAGFARVAVAGLDLQGLVLAGLIIAALGVLDDVTISQASTVFALHDTDRELSWAALFGRAMKVGRDHIASVVNTLFLAYAGASLTLLVLFSTSGLPSAELVASEVFATEVIKTVVGSLGLIAAVPLTTALAASVALRRAAPAPSRVSATGGQTDPAGS